MTLFVAVMIVCVSLATLLYISLRQSGYEHIASLILVTAILLIPTTCLLTLYVPKLPPVVSLGQYCRHKLPTATNKVTFLVFLKFNHLVSMKGKEQNEINKQLKLINHCGSFVNNMEFLVWEVESE